MIQRDFAAIFTGLQHNSENRSTSNRIFRQIMSTFRWILLKIVGADRKMRSSLPIGHQLRLLSIVVMYYKTQNSEESSHKSFVFSSNESRNDAILSTLTGKLVPLLKEVVPDLEMVHYWTDSPTSQYRNCTIFKIINKKYFGVTASWNFMEAGHGKGPCDSIGGVAKRKADQAVKNGKCHTRRNRFF